MADEPTIADALHALLPSARHPEPEPEMPSVGSADGGVRANLPKPPPDVGRLLRVALKGWDDER